MALDVLPASHIANQILPWKELILAILWS
jgi:hypothetical protein